jgi:hypothetical protein
MEKPDYNRVKKLFLAAVEFEDQDARERFLTEECQSDALHMRAVKHLLDFHRTGLILFRCRKER